MVGAIGRHVNNLRAVNQWRIDRNLESQAHSGVRGKAGNVPGDSIGGKSSAQVSTAAHIGGVGRNRVGDHDISSGSSGGSRVAQQNGVSQGCAGSSCSHRHYTFYRL